MNTRALPILLGTLFLLSILAGCDQRVVASGMPYDPVARGSYLVRTMGCGDCHTPRDQNGKEIAGLELTGHPADAPLPSWEPAMLEKQNLATIAATGTAFAGPFGISVAPNLTPDRETGTGELTADGLLQSWRSGKHWREDRMVLPPMPVPYYRELEEADVRAIHAYLHSLKPQRNQAPQSKPAPH
jgi:mono/diheme cytochrome c family protein